MNVLSHDKFQILENSAQPPKHTQPDSHPPLLPYNGDFTLSNGTLELR